MRQCSMNSTAVIFFCVLVVWLLCKRSVDGQKCNNLHPRYIFIAVPWYTPSNGRGKENYHSSESETDNDVPVFRDMLPTFNASPEENLPPFERPDNFLASLGFGVPNYYPYANNHNPGWAGFPNNIRNSPHKTAFGNGWNQNGSPYQWNNESPSKKDSTVVAEMVSDVNSHPNWQYFDREECGESLADRIIGGTSASLGQYPWLALLGFKNRSQPRTKAMFSCGGALINPCWVVSAAHCLSDLPPGYYVSGIRLGEYNLDTKMDCDSAECADPVQDFSPVQLITHELFNQPKLKNDISLIKLNRPALISKWVQPICLPYNNILTENLLDKIGEVAGWGVDNIDTLSTSKILQTIKLPVRPLDSCRKVYKKKAHIDDRQICVGGAMGFDSCNGDSGGPFMKVSVADGSTPKYYLFGIVSFGAAKCGKKPTPGVYTKVSIFTSWILNHVTGC